MPDSKSLLPAPFPTQLTAEQFRTLAAVPPENEWFTHLGNKGTRRVYEPVIRDFMRFTGITTPQEFRTVTRAHVLAWRDDLHTRKLAAATIRRHLASLSSLFDYLCEKNAVTHNPVDGVKRPPVDSYKGKTPALGDAQARRLLNFPAGHSLKDKRDRALLATLLNHGLRRSELCKLRVKDAQQQRRGVTHLKISGKGGKTRFVPLHPAASGFIADYLEAAGHGNDDAGALFRPLHHSRGDSEQSVTPDGVYKPVREYSTPLALRLGRIVCGQQRPPMPSNTARIWPKSNRCSATRISPPPACTISATAARNRVRCSKCATELFFSL